MDPESIAQGIAESIHQVLALHESAAVAVSSGPRLLPVLGALAALALPWDRIRFLMADDVAGPPSDPRSRYRQLYDGFFERIGFAPGRVLRFWSEGEPPEAVAGYYGDMTAEVLELSPGEAPRLDLVLLELSPDGSVGAFVPGSSALGEGGGFARAVEVAGGIRYTLSGETIRRARRVVVVGERGVAASPVVAALRPPEGDLVCVTTRETGSSGAASHP